MTTTPEKRKKVGKPSSKSSKDLKAETGTNFTKSLFEKMKNDPISRERRTHLALSFGYTLEAWDSLPDETQDAWIEQLDES